MRWFETEALKTDRKIPVFSHAPLHNAGVFGEGMPLGIKPYDDTLNAPRILHAIACAPNVIVYHFYCTCNDRNERYIAAAASRPFNDAD